MTLEREEQVAIELADEAGKIALEVYGRTFEWEEKSGDRGPVTEADERINEFLVRRLREAFPEHTVVGEESKGVVDLNADRLWVIDPIDGTKDFLKKNGEWSIMIGFTVGGRSVLGVVLQPTVDKLYVGVEGRGARMRTGQVWTDLQVSEFSDASLATIVGSRSHPDARIEAVRDRLGITREYAHGSVGCKLAQISEQRAELYFNLSGRCGIWDTCGPEAIIRAAGGDLVTFDGTPIEYSGTNTTVEAPFFATTSALKPSVLEALNALRGEWSV